MKVERITPILFAENIEPCLEFWVEGLGFEKNAEVPTAIGSGSRF